MKLITVLMPERYLEALEDLIKRKYYPNRAEAIRTAVRDLLSEEVWQSPAKTPGISPHSFSPADQAMTFKAITLPKAVNKQEEFSNDQ